MNLYLLERKRPAGYDETEAIVVRAKSPKEARKLATGCQGDEGPVEWLNPANSTCRVLRSEGQAGYIIRSYKAG